MSSSTFPGAASLAYITPRVVRPTLPVSLAPYAGSTMVRVWTAVIGARMLKISAPSRKKGRSSG